LQKSRNLRNFVFPLRKVARCFNQLKMFKGNRFKTERSSRWKWSLFIGISFKSETDSGPGCIWAVAISPWELNLNTDVLAVGIEHAIFDSLIPSAMAP